MPPPPRATITRLRVRGIAGAVALLAVGPHDATAPPVPPVPSVPAVTSEPAPTTTAPLVLVDGRFDAPDGTFSIAFTAAPVGTVDAVTGVETFAAPAGEDNEMVTRAPLDTSADPAPTTSERMDEFLSAYGDEHTELARVDTVLWTFPATYFIDEVTLEGGVDATLYGVVTTRDDRVTTAVYTDVGGDDNAAATAFVGSYTVIIDSYYTTFPGALTNEVLVFPGTPTSDVTSTPSISAASSTTVASTTAPSTTVAEPPAGVVVAADGRWWAVFPEGANRSYTASLADGFTYSQYSTTVDGDTLSIRAVNVPEAFEWIAADVAAAIVAADGATVERSEPATVGGRTAVRFAYPVAGRGTEYVMSVDDGDQIIEVRYSDGGTPSEAAADAFIDSFMFAS